MAAPALLAPSSPASVISSGQKSAQGHMAFAMALAESMGRRSDAGPAPARELLIAENFGPRTFRAVLRRRTDAKTRLLLCATGFSACPDWLMRVALRSADAVVADGDEALRGLARLSAAGPRVFASTNADRNDLAPFLQCPLYRTGDDAHRLVFSDDLVPQTGAADFLLAAMAWADRSRDRTLDIVWIGDGILKDVLRAQPLPPNLSQRFIDRLPAVQIADIFAQSGILVAPTAFGHAGHPVLQALAAGIPVLGSIHCRCVRQWVRDAETGWVSDPLHPGALFHALTRALATSTADLDRMRRSARADVEIATAPTVVGRVRHAVDMLLESGEPDLDLKQAPG